MKKLLWLLIMCIGVMWAQPTSGSVTKIKAGTNVTVSPTSGRGIVTINSSGGGIDAATAGQIARDTVLVHATKMSSNAGFPSYWVTTDSISWYKPVIQIPFDSSYINLTDTVFTGMFPFPMIIDSMSFVSQMNTGASLTYKVLYGTSMLSGWTAVVSAGNATTSITTGDMVTALNNSTPAANSRIAVLFSSVTTKPKKAELTIFYHLN